MMLAREAGQSPAASIDLPRPLLKLRGAALLGIVAALATLGFVGASRIQKVYPDFEYFYKAGSWMLHRGAIDPGYDILPTGEVLERDSLKWYLPFVSRFMTLFAWMDPVSAGKVWLAMNLLASFGVVYILGRYISTERPDHWPLTQFLPFAFTFLFWYWEYRLNQINALTLLCIVTSFAAWLRKRRFAAGVMLGVAMLLKVSPALLVGWFLLKRDFRTAGIAVLTVALAGPVGDLIAFGPEQTQQYYSEWLHNVATTGSNRGLILNQRELDYRNQATCAALSRWFHPTSYSLRFDNDPRLTARQPDAFVNVASWSLESVATISTGVSLCIVAMLFFFCRKAAGALTPIQLRIEWSLFLLAILLLMPILRLYHLVWVMPPLTILGAAASELGRRGIAFAAPIAAALLIATQLATNSQAMQARGVLLAGLICLAVTAAIFHITLGRAERSFTGDDSSIFGDATKVPNALGQNVRAGAAKEPAS